MRIHFSPLGKTIAGIFLIGSALLITGWTLAHSPKSEPAAQPFIPSTPVIATVVTQDHPLVKKVQAALAKKAELKGEDIKVEAADDGKVRLSGKTSHPSKRVMALKVAEKAAGKKKVINQLDTDCSGGQQCTGSTPYCCPCARGGWCCQAASC